MSDTQHNSRPDAFAATMAAARAQSGRPELARQSLGAPMSDGETALATALMEIYASGATDPDDVAAALTARGARGPISGAEDWTADALMAELQALNAKLDAAYEENGFGA